MPNGLVVSHFSSSSEEVPPSLLHLSILSDLRISAGDGYLSTVLGCFLRLWLSSSSSRKRTIVLWKS